MKITKIHLENFRGYKSLDLSFNSEFNFIIGDNGSGKTALLEALTVAVGTFFLGIRNVNSRNIAKRDIRINSNEISEEYAYPVKVYAEAEIYNEQIKLQRQLNGLENRTILTASHQIKAIAKYVDSAVRDGLDIKLPLLIYYATGRLFDEARNHEEVKEVKQQIASRFRAYDRCLEAKSTHNQFRKWFKGKELSKIQKGTTDLSLDLVKKAIIENIPNCKNFYFEFDPDKPQGLKIELADGRILPFSVLSDGTRNFFAIVADMAYKCVTLNPQLKENALLETEGVVLIDELDLHLHPEWQRKIVSVLRNTFPKIQFIVSTHSPFIIQESREKQLIVLKNSEVLEISSGVNLSIEDIAEELQDIINPQWSKPRIKMFEVASEYYKAVKEGKDTPEMKKKLDEAMKPFALDTAFYAIIEQEKIIQDYKKNKQ